jgi:hypothetical protein
MSIEEKFYQSLPAYTKGSLQVSSPPQSEAYNWVTTIDQYPEQVAPKDEATRLFRMTQRFALATLLYSSDGVGGIDPTASECDWFDNVTCGEGSRVDVLGVIGTGGTIPREIALLSSLTSLSLDQNQRTSTIPTELGLLSGLTLLSLGRNQLTSTIPTELGRLTSLTYLGLYSTQLTSSIPTELGLLTELESLYLQQNRLGSTIPTELGRLSLLQHLWLDGNQLVGIFPTALCQYPKYESGSPKVDCAAVSCTCCFGCNS